MKALIPMNAFIQSIRDFNLIAVHDYLKTIAGFIS